MRDSLKSLNPSLPTRISQWLRPDWSRTVLARRVAAGGLVVLAAVAALRPNPDGVRAQVVVAARDLSPGAELTADDLRLEKRLAPTIPDGSQSDIGTVVGSTLAGPTRRGEVLTDVRLLGRRLAESAAGPDARIVPVHPSDSALTDLVRPGDVVDVVAASDADSHANPVMDHGFEREIQLPRAPAAECPRTSPSITPATTSVTPSAASSAKSVAGRAPSVRSSARS